MIDVVLKVLVILGIVLLVVVSLCLVALLLLLFFPFTYRIRGEKSGESFWLSFRVNWLFGLFRVRFLYPDPGRLRVKALFLTLFDKKIPPEKVPDAQEEKAGPQEKSAKGNNTEENSAPQDQGKAGQADAKAAAEKADKKTAEGSQGDSPKPQAEEEASGTEEKKSFPEKISEKIRELQEKILGIIDKIKKIWKNISYYVDLLQEENTKQLAAHAAKRAWKILKSIRPRRMKGEILFGTGSPDTTGYLYGAYCAASAILGAGFFVTPDFERKRFEGEFDVAGRVCVWVLLANGLGLILDKRLRVFLKRLKAGSGQKKEASA